MLYTPTWFPRHVRTLTRDFRVTLHTHIPHVISVSRSANPPNTWITRHAQRHSHVISASRSALIPTRDFRVTLRTHTQHMTYASCSASPQWTHTMQHSQLTTISHAYENKQSNKLISHSKLHIYQTQSIKAKQIKQATCSSKQIDSSHFCMKHRLFSWLRACWLLYCFISMMVCE
jgi:hypothetical protein